MRLFARIVERFPQQTARDAELLTAELVSNAVRHAATPDIVLGIDTNACVRVEVIDAGSLFQPPGLDDPHEVRPNGWGLFLVDRLARAWGVEAEGTGKKVWFELDPASVTRPTHSQRSG